MKQLANVLFLLTTLFCGAFPQNDISQPGMQCYNCTSKDLANCAINPTSGLPKVNCKDPKDECITSIVDDVTLRGCKSELNVPFDAISVECLNSLCNSDLFPKDRLKCYQCEGKDCINNFQGTLKPCVKYDKEDYCITDVIDESDVIRGCNSDPNYSPGAFAEMCQESGCNNHPIAYSSECTVCSEANSTNCVRISPPVQTGKICTVPKDNTCEDTLLLNRPIQCFTYEASNKVVRGCLKDAGKLALDSDNFKTCQGQLCNNECLRIKCVKCDSRTHPKCANQANELEPQLCPNDMACFVAQTSEGATIRGCGEYSTEAKHISTCYEDGCNNKVHHTPTDASGVTGNHVPPIIPGKDDRSKEGNKGLTGSCEGDDCNKNALVSSSPHSEADKSKSDNQVHPSISCPGDGCKKNTDETTKNNVQPDEQKWDCYQCTGSTEECRGAPAKSMLKPCAAPTDTCYQYVNAHNEMVRGCKLDDSYSKCLKSSEKCMQCSSKGCNSLPAVITGDLSCLECGESNENCPYTLNKDDITKCHSEAPFYAKEFSCFSCLSKDNTTASRGCQWGSSVTTDDSTCTTCTSDNCNDQALVQQSCLQCAGDRSTCNASVPGTVCRKLYLHKLGCFTRIIGNYRQRGCVSDLLHVPVCEADEEKYCKICLGQNCNTSGAAKLFARIGVILAPLLVSLCFTF